MESQAAADAARHGQMNEKNSRVTKEMGQRVTAARKALDWMLKEDLGPQVLP
jgi:hypothetical protein